ncbi:pyriculol/pyriculariol biosynthesis cluster transcription factor 1-like [Fagus crenata]
MEQEDNLVWFNMEQYISDGGLYNAVHQFHEVGSTSHHHGLQISEVVNNNADQQTQLKDDSDIEAVLNYTPLGLKLTITDSYENLINCSLNREKNIECVDETSHNLGLGGVQAKASNDFKKPKALKLRASLIRIGEWQEVAQHNEDLLVKCYFSKRQLIWEVLPKSTTLKKKIEINWCDILAIRTIIEEHKPGVLEIELNNPPSFHEENDLAPGKHITWHVSADFTNGQALIYRRHYIEFHPGVLEKYKDGLLKLDLLKLSKKSFPTLSSPYFNSNFLGTTAPLVDMPQAPAYPQAKRPCLRVNYSTSPISTTNFPLHSNYIISNQGTNYPRMAIQSPEMINNASVPRRDQIQGPHSISTILQVNSAQMRDQIRGSYSIPTIPQVNYAPMRDQIQVSHSIKPTISQVNHAYDPMRDQIQGPQSFTTIPEENYVPRRYQIQGPHSISTIPQVNYAPVRDQIRGSHSIPTIPQVNYVPMRDQIQGPHSINPIIPQVNPAYVPMRDQIQGSHSIKSTIFQVNHAYDPMRDQIQGPHSITTIPEENYVPMRDQIEGPHSIFAIPQVNYAPMRDQIQGSHSIPTIPQVSYVPMRDQIQGSHSIKPTIPQVNHAYDPMRDQIQGPHSIPTIPQVINPNIFHQNNNVSAPRVEGSEGLLSDAQRLANLRKQLLHDHEEVEVQDIEQNEKYIARIKSLTNLLLDWQNEQNSGNNTQTQDITRNQLSAGALQHAQYDHYQ